MPTPHTSRAAAIAGAAIAGLLATSSAHAQTCHMSRTSIDSNGYEGDGGSSQTSISGDGQFVAFTSAATNLVASDKNFFDDVFVRDVRTGKTERISEPMGGGEGDGPSGYASISADGRYVVFSSWARNLVPGDANNTNDVFLRDRLLGTTERVDVPPAGLGSETDYSSFFGAISPNGRFVTFLSFATNLVPNDTNQTRDVFLLDRASGVIERVSVGSQGQESDDMSGGSGLSAFVSADGRYVAFTSSATNLVPGDTNGLPDVFLRDRQLGTTRRLSLGAGGAEPDDACEATAISTDGRVVGFTSAATNLVPGDTNQSIDCFVVTLATGAIERVSVADNGAEGSLWSWALTLSGDGRFAAFLSTSPDLVLVDTNNRRDVFVRDIPGHTTTLMSVSDTGVQGDADCYGLSISGDGAAVAFASQSWAFVLFDNNSTADTFHRECHASTLYCPGTYAGCPCGNAGTGRSGCASATTAGALLDTQGAASVSADTLTLVASGLPEGTPVMFLESAQVLSGGFGSAVGDGVRCVGSPVTRLGVRYSNAGAATFGFLGTDPLLSVASSIPTSGAVRRYQAWYRDAAPFCSPQTFNFTNGAEVPWTP